MRGRVGVVMLGVLGCATSPPEALVEADDTRSGLDGADGPFGAARLRLSVQARVSEVVSVEVVFPTESEDLAEEPVAAVTDAPAVVFTQGALASPDRYFWLATHWATRGYVVVLPRAELDVPLTQPGNGALALEAVRAQSDRSGPLEDVVSDDGPVTAVGHSMGGTAAARQWVRDDAIDLLVMLASVPADRDAVEEEGSRPVVAIGGSTDELLPPDDFVEGGGRFANAELWVVEGLNHFGWSDDVSGFEAGLDGPLEGDLDALRLTAHRLIDPALDAVLRGVGERPSAVDGAERVTP